MYISMNWGRRRDCEDDQEDLAISIGQKPGQSNVQETKGKEH